MENSIEKFNRMMKMKIRTNKKLTGCAVPFRTVLLILNGVFILISLGLIGLSIAAFVEFHTYSAIISTEIPVGLLLVAILMLFVSTLGFCGTLKNNRCMLMVYFAILVLMMIGQFLVAYFSSSSKQTSFVRPLLLKGWIAEYNHTETLNFFQATFCCCGFMNDTDYAVAGCANSSTIVYSDSTENKHIVCNLDSTTSSSSGSNDTATWPGCFEKLETVWSQKLNLITGISLTVGCLEAIAVAFSCILFCCISCCSYEEEEEDPYLEDLDRRPLTRNYFDRDSAFRTSSRDRSLN